MNLTDQRKAIRRLLDETEPADAAAVYYAFHHPVKKTQITTYPLDSSSSTGFVCSAMTGLDLFRPLVSMRLPLERPGQELNYSNSLELIYNAVPIGASLIISTKSAYYPLISAVFDIEREERLRLLVLNPDSFSPIINVLVSGTISHNNLPRFVIRKNERNSDSELAEIIASAGINWQSPSFAEIYVHTKNHFRRQGMGTSVGSYIVQAILESGRTPLYGVSFENDPSYQLARSVGFFDSGIEEILIEGSLKPRPDSLI